MPRSMQISRSQEQLPGRLPWGVSTGDTWLPELPEETKNKYGELTPASWFLGSKWSSPLQLINSSPWNSYMAPSDSKETECMQEHKKHCIEWTLFLLHYTYIFLCCVPHTYVNTYVFGYFSLLISETAMTMVIKYIIELDRKVWQAAAH